MKRSCLVFGVFILTVILPVSCGPPTRVDTDESKRCVPHGLTLSETDNQYALISWNPGCPGTRIMRGFNIYLSPVPLVDRYPGHEMPNSIVPFNRKIYPGDTIGDPNRETYECKEIGNAAVYFAHVRAVYNDNTLSVPTNEIEVISYPQGEIVVTVSYSGEKDGFSFEKNDFCRTDAIENDIYYYHRDGQDFLCSPSRLGPVNRVTKIYTAGEGAILDKRSDIVPNGDSSEKVQLTQNGIYILITEDGFPVRLRVKEITGEGDKRTVKLEYIYKPPVKRLGEITS